MRFFIIAYSILPKRHCRLDGFIIDFFRYPVNRLI
nr:MAG TPA: hypothetical protein [Caudoviricetes sp.]